MTCGLWTAVMKVLFMVDISSLYRLKLLHLYSRLWVCWGNLVLMLQLTPEIWQIECCIDEWITGVKEDIKFSSAAYSSVYMGHLSSLQRFDERTSAYKLLGKITDNILDVARYVPVHSLHHWLKVMARLHAGVNLFQETRATPFGFTDNIFDDAIREYEAETREAARERSHEVMGSDV